MDYRSEVFPSQSYESIVDMRAVHYIKEHIGDLELGEYYDDKRKTGDKMVSCKSEPTLVLNFLDFYSRIKGTNYGRRIDCYKQSKTNPRRMTTEKMSIQGISRQIRHTLCRDNQYDFDIDNCHPVLLKNWCDKNGVVCTRLTDFNDNRKERFSQVQETMEWTKSETKVYVLRLINGGGLEGEKNLQIKNKLKKLSWYNPLLKELCTIRTHVYQKYPALMKKAIKNKGAEYYNIDGVCLSYLLTNLENQVLNIMVNACIKRRVKIGGTIYDGFQAYKDTIPDVEEFMGYLEQEMLVHSGYTLKVSMKEMDEGLVIPEEYNDPERRAELLKEEEKLHKQQIRDEKQSEKQIVYEHKQAQKALKKESSEKLSDLEYAELFLSKTQGEIVYDKKMGFGYMYNRITRLWGKFTSFDSLDEQVIKHLGLDSAKNIRNVNTVIKRLLMNREDDLTQFNMRAGFLAIKNKKIIDMKTLQVRDRVKGDYCSFELAMDYTPDYNKEWVNDYIGQILKTTDQAYIDQVVEIFGYVMSGENNLKMIIMLVGSGDNGKSLFAEVLNNMMEQYAVPANPKIFKKPKFENNTHEAHLYPLIGKRGAFMSELSAQDTFNDTVMKRASGNDRDSIRNSGSDVSLSVTLKAVLIVLTNQVPKSECDTLWKRLTFIDFANTFERDGNKEKEIKGHQADLFCAFMEGAHRYYQNDMKIHFVDQISSFTKLNKDSKDSVIEFMKENTIQPSEQGQEYCKDVYQMYSDFSYRGDLVKVGKETFYKQFESAYGLVKEKNKNGNYYRIMFS
jgi:P4 family phage/plasmid primase-like protien